MDDLISRKLAIKAIRNAVDQWNIVDPFHVGIKRGLICGERIVGSLPSAESVWMKGKWIETEVLPKAFDVNGIGTWASKMQCDQCEFITYAIEGRMGQYNFCPNCGADMRS